MALNYENRKFVFVTNNTQADTSWKELRVARAYFSNQMFSRDEYINFTMDQIRIRPGYRSQGGGDYAKLEAGKRFSTLRNVGIIVEIKLEIQ